MNSNKRLGNKLFKKFFGGDDGPVGDAREEVTEALGAEQEKLIRLEIEQKKSPSNEGQKAVDEQKVIVQELENADASIKKVEIAINLFTSI